jgi:hypothetical protein
MTSDLSDRVSAVCCDAVSEFFAPVANCYNTLRVSIPCNIVDTPRDNMVSTYNVSVPGTDMNDVISEERQQKPSYLLC